jgi:hypothetical protein
MTKVRTRDKPRKDNPRRAGGAGGPERGRLALLSGCQAPAQTRVSVPHSARQDSTMLLLPTANVAQTLLSVPELGRLQLREPLPPTSKPASQPCVPEPRDSKASPARHPEHPLQSEVVRPDLAAVESRSTSSEGRLQTPRVRLIPVVAQIVIVPVLTDRDVRGGFRDWRFTFAHVLVSIG